MGFRPRTEITSLFASLMGRLTASLGTPHGVPPPDHKAGGSRHCDGGAHGGEICWESRMLPLGRESLGTPQGVPLGTPRDASRRSTPQITKPVGPVIATGVLTVARFVGKVGSYLLVASLSGRLRASLSGRLTAFHPPDHKAGGSRHCDGGAHGGEICPSRELDDPLASQQPCGGLLGPEALPLVGRAPGCDLSDPSQVMEPRGPTSHTAMAMDPVHGNQSSFGSTDVTLTAQ